MNIEFTNSVPEELRNEIVIISGKESVKWSNVEYLVLKDNDTIKKVLQIRFEAHCSPFKDAIIRDNLLAVGHQGHFYLYNFLENINVLVLQVDGYFGHFYINENLFYVTGSDSICCINEKGNLIWKNPNLGVDGILIKRFGDNKIYGSSECDPPSGWQDFVLDITTGKLIND
ncbi:hypothetical protein [Niastella populi]|uniref:Uncharacterized protein n=1 Tax=Niastella populi TaxID=550983 RepID=A0A1V9G7J0_9BACT|nr:hypothetical protein [Niastella populi]OQP66619.1 hypothetical protein A4R26_33465 [Niastella populi]